MSVRIVCGWCGTTTADDAPCSDCRHDPLRPYEQRGVAAPVIDERPGRPALDEQEIRRRYADAVASIRASGAVVTLDELAARLDRTPRTVREWRDRFGLQ